MFAGKSNISAGFLFLSLFMLYGFFLIYLRDFAPGKEQWIADYGVGAHFESRLAHVHGNLFALLNVAVGLVLLRMQLSPTSTRWISGLALVGMLMPLGILAEVLFGVPPIFVIVGGVSMVLALGWLSFEVWQAEIRP
ncbi:hypothetical protein [Marivita sp. S2033]|uniref:hypothetical protein n=1 Tax=Marivita sp. S2033 TaxID=3373187 RepID=UPI0039822701